jgi:signal transduction histidine kinase
LTLENIQLNQLILDLIDDCQPNNSDNLKLKTELDSDCDIHSDFVVISIILKNLIENAIKYNLEGETIEIKAFKLFDSSSNEEHEKRKYQVQFEISNQFDPITRPNEFEMFNRYYRQNNVLSKPGMGIGLSVVKQLLKQLEKEITYNITESQVTFKIIF